MRSSPAAVFATCIGATLLSAPVTPIVSVAGATPATSTPSAAGGASPAASSTPSATQPPTSLSAPAPPIVSLAGASAWRCNSPGIGATPATSTPSAAGGATPAAPPTPSATPSDTALKMVQKHYPSPSTTSGQTPLLGYSSHFASPLQSLNESLDLQLTHTPPSRPDPLHKRRRVEPSLNISDKAHEIWSPWEENPSSEAKENINVTVKEVKKELRDIGASLNKVANSVKGRRKGANLSFKSGEIDKAKHECQKLHKTPMKLCNLDWHKEAQQFIKEWSYVRKL